jgi:hypothetical protein
MKDVLLINNPQVYNITPSGRLFSEYLKDKGLNSVTYKKTDGPWSNQTNVLNSIKDTSFMKKEEAIGEGTIISSTISFFGRDMLRATKGGYLVIFSEQVRELQGFLKRCVELNEEGEEVIKTPVSMFNTLFPLSDAQYLWRQADIVVIQDDILVMNITRKGNFNIHDMRDYVEAARKEPLPIEEIFSKYVKTFTEFRFRLEVPVMAGAMCWVDNETPLEIELQDLISSVKPALAPVKPSIAAAMLATGSGSGLSESMDLDGDDCILKTAIVQTKFIERMSMNGVTINDESIGWEAQLGLFNKTKKSFEILS